MEADMYNRIARTRAVRPILSAALLLMAGACSVFGGAAAPEPKYETVRADEAFEIRDYGELVLVKTSMGVGDKDAFGRLFDYISGENEGARKIDMTAPVLATLSGGGTVRQDVAAFLEAANRAATAEGAPRGCFVVCSLTDLEGLHETAANRVRNGAVAVEDCVRRRLADAVASADLPADFPVAQRAALLITLVQGMKVRARAGADWSDLSSTAATALEAALGPAA
jgi:AcrR family transcriptional regulator